MFIFRHRAMQLAYLDPTFPSNGGYVDLPCWIWNHSDLAVAIASIREKKWGNILQSDFHLKVWNNFTNGTADADVPSYNRIFGPSGDTPITTPSYMLLRNNLIA